MKIRVKDRRHTGKETERVYICVCFTLKCKNFPTLNFSAGMAREYCTYIKNIFWNNVSFMETNNPKLRDT